MARIKFGAFPFLSPSHPPRTLMAEEVQRTKPSDPVIKALADIIRREATKCTTPGWDSTCLSEHTRRCVGIICEEIPLDSLGIPQDFLGVIVHLLMRYVCRIKDCPVVVDESSESSLYKSVQDVALDPMQDFPTPSHVTIHALMEDHDFQTRVSELIDVEDSDPDADLDHSPPPMGDLSVLIGRDVDECTRILRQPHSWGIMSSMLGGCQLLQHIVSVTEFIHAYLSILFNADADELQVAIDCARQPTDSNFRAVRFFRHVHTECWKQTSGGCFDSRVLSVALGVCVIGRHHHRLLPPFERTQRSPWTFACDAKLLGVWMTLVENLPGFASLTGDYAEGEEPDLFMLIAGKHPQQTTLSNKDIAELLLANDPEMTKAAGRGQ